MLPEAQWGRLKWTGGPILEYALWLGDVHPERTLVLLHEGLGCVAMWRRFPAELCARTGWTVFAYSRRGYGGSSPVAVPRPASYMHDEAKCILPRVLAWLAPAQFVLVGHSDGASIALIYAGDKPADTLRGMVLMAPHVFVEPLTLQAIAAAGQAYRNTDLRARLRKYHGDRVDGAFWGWNQIWLSGAFKQWNLQQYVPRIEVPVQLIQGAADNYGTHAQLSAIANACTAPLAQTWLEDCGHSPQRDAPAATLSAIESLLARAFL